MNRMIDVAKFILERTGEISAMKLQKLMYYAQAWSLVWREEALFPEDFEAWANGPVIQELYDRHRGMFRVNSDFLGDADAAAVGAPCRESIDKVLEFYGPKTAQWLSNLTHQEDPWVQARGDTPPMASSNAVITQASIHEYYSSL